jgi:hypothetical protein
MLLPDTVQQWGALPSGSGEGAACSVRKLNCGFGLYVVTARLVYGLVQRAVPLLACHHCEHSLGQPGGIMQDIISFLDRALLTHQAAHVSCPAQSHST